MKVIPLTVAARNEERSLGACLDSLLSARRYAEARLPIRLDVVVALDQCTDRSAEVARARGVACVESAGGKVEAQRTGNRPGEFQIFSDADIRVPEDALYALCAAMLDNPKARVAFPPKRPLPPRRRTPLAWALHVYNARRGFASAQSWFSGKLFAIRGWSIPGPEEIARRARALPADGFYQYASPLLADDVYLSRWALAEGGAAALVETKSAPILFRAPESWLGMYRYYRRLQRELTRIDRLFPEWVRPPDRARDLLPGSPWGDRVAWQIFRGALAICRVAYRVERLYRRGQAAESWSSWPAILETKEL
jgi:cellulose synthase/poly-beta-1,6-N-acetylglucosamine synthase-like glycosyltransferase